MKNYLVGGFVAAFLFVFHGSMAPAQTISVSPSSPSAAADDIIQPGVFTLTGSLLGINVNGMSYGRGLAEYGPLFLLEFSVDPGSVGSGGAINHVILEKAGAGGGIDDHPADIFRDDALGGNIQVVDGDGIANPVANGPAGGLSLVEPIAQPGDDVDAWDSRALTVLGGGGFFYAIDAPSAGLGGHVSSADIYNTGPGPFGGYDTVPPSTLYVGAGSLMLDLSGPATDDIDALIVFEDGASGITAGDIILFSLAPGSAAFGNGSPYTGFTAADIFVATGIGGTASYGVHRTGGAMGLSGGDNVDALDITSQIPEPLTAISLVMGLGLISMYRRFRGN